MELTLQASVREAGRKYIYWPDFKREYGSFNKLENHIERLGSTDRGGEADEVRRDHGK